MKFLILSVFVAISCAIHGATVSLHNGLNDVNASGKIEALEAVTVTADQAVSLKSVSTLVEYTNCYATVYTRHDRYDFTITNYDGSAAVSTNVIDRFSYADWMRGTTNLIIGSVSHSYTNTSELVLSNRLPKATYVVTNDLASGTASGHYLIVSPDASKFFTGNGKILVTAGAGDALSLILK